MRKLLSAATAIAVLTSFTGCSSKKEKSVPQVKTEIIGTTDSSTDVSEDKPKENITLNYAVYGEMDKEEYNLIKKFNETDNGYVIVTKDYSEYLSPEEDGSILYDEDKARTLNIKLIQDISNGDIDIVRDYYLSGSQTMNRLSSRGAFINLYEMMNTDSEINKNTLNSHILELHETEGNLYCLPFNYTISTLIGESRYVGDNEGWTLDEMISCWEKMPEGSMIEGHKEKNYVYLTILRGMLGSFIDYKNAKANFDSADFKKALEFCNSFDDIYGKYSDPELNAVNFVFEQRFYGFAETHVALCDINVDNYTFVGYPSDDGCGGFINTSGNRLAICSTVTEKEKIGAWEFIRSYCLDDFQTDYYCRKETVIIDGERKEMYLEPKGFPINVSVYNKLANETMNGKLMDSTISVNENQSDIGFLTKKELEHLTDYTNKIQNLSVTIDDDLNKIINDEIIDYFNSEISIDDCVALIQNRAELMVSEKQ